MDPRHPFVPVARLTETVSRLRPQLKLELKQLSQCVRIWPAILEEPLASHTQPMDLRNHELYVGAESPVWAHSLRHRQAAVLHALRANGLSVARLVVRVTSIPDHLRSQPSARDLPSDSVSDTMEITARGIPDSGLRDALLRLSKTLRG